ncbi:MAG: trigger factor [Eggerthellaceae bacterium]|nr:trigger factor [Eggerthellaceae bacterium]
METKVEALEGNRAKVTVTVEEATVSDRIKKQYKEFANKYNFPGFRKGKAPRPVVDSMLGKEAVRAAVTDDLVNETFPLAIDGSGLFPVGQPSFGEDMEIVEDKADYVYSFEIDTKPTPELTSYDNVEIELPAEGASDAEIDEEIDALLEHYYEIVDAPANTKVKEDKYVDIAVKATDDNGEDISSISTGSMEYGLGSGLLPKTFDDELIGLKKGDTKQFTIDVPVEPTAMTSSVLGKTSQINFDVEIRSVRKRSLPKLTDEWVKSKIGMDDVAALRKEIEDEIIQSKDAYLPRMKEARSLAALAERLEGDLPEGLVEEAETSLLQDFFTQLQRQGVTLDAYLQQQGINSAQFRDDIKSQANDVVRQDLALDAWAQHYGIEVTDEDVHAEFENSGVSDPEALFEEWRKNGQMHVIKLGVIRQKAAADLVEKAQVTEAKPEEDALGKTGKHAAKESEEPDEEAAEE